MKSRVALASVITLVAGGVGTALVVSSCDGVCPTKHHPSVMFEAQSDDGAPIRPDAVWVSPLAEASTVDGVDGRGPMWAPVPASCVDDSCTTWVVGMAHGGPFRVWASHGGKTLSADRPLTIPDDPDGCHVETGALRFGPQEQPTPTDLAPGGCRLQDARPSVFVTTVSKHGHEIAVPADEVSFLVEGESVPEAAFCVDEACSRWIAGWERAGTFTVTATACGDTASLEVDVPMAASGCHVETQYVSIPVDGARCKKELALPQHVACDEPPGPAVFIGILRQEFDYVLPVENAEVRYRIGDETRERPATCSDPSCAMWVTGSEPGDYTVTASACGETYEAQVSVAASADGCDIETQFLNIFVDEEDCMIAPSDGEPGQYGFSG